MKSSTYLPFLVTLTTANAAALLPRAFDLGPYVVNAASSVVSDNVVEASSIVSSNSAAIAAIETPANYVVAPAANPGVPLSVAATTTYSPPPASASSAAAELNALMDEIMNSTLFYNETYPYYGGYYNGSYNGSHHHHHHNSSYWNSTDFLNITEYYNATNNLVEVVTVEANGTTTMQYHNVTDGYGYGYGYGYGNYNGSGWGHHHNHTGQYNGTGWWTELMANETNTDTAATDTATAVAPLSTGTGLPTAYDLTNKPGFTGPKQGKRASKLYGRWLSGVI